MQPQDWQLLIYVVGVGVILYLMSRTSNAEGRLKEIEESKRGRKEHFASKLEFEIDYGIEKGLTAEVIADKILEKKKSRLVRIIKRKIRKSKRNA